MNYKVGDEVLVKAKLAGCTSSARIMLEVDRNKLFANEEDIIPVPDMTAEEAWEIAKKILLYPAHGGFNSTELEEIFGRTEHLWELTPQEAKAKIEVWKAGKEIKVGDEVELKSSPDNDDYKFFVTYIDNGRGRISGFSGFDGSVFCERETKRYQKTGRHIDIEGMLKQIGEYE